MSPERLEATSIPMAMRQRIIPSRRDYNRWVADQTLEDYALRFTAISARRWPISAVANTALGATSFLALEAIGAVITLRYGFANAAAAILVGAVLIFLTALPIAIGAARHGLDIDLLTRGAGFGYIGSTVTSLIYASFTFLFFGIEASILAVALQDCLGIPQWLGQLLAALVVIPVVTGGITLISRFQRWTQPLWLLLNILPFAAPCLARARARRLGPVRRRLGCRPRFGAVRRRPCRRAIAGCANRRTGGFPALPAASAAWATLALVVRGG